MNIILPKVYLVGHTVIDPSGMVDYLEDIGAAEWAQKVKNRYTQEAFPTDDFCSDSEKLIEFYGRLCYKSWEPGMNPNVKKVREGNRRYLKNIMESKHGSVLEHATLNFVFSGVSRVFTHELVRHRVGTAISQESLRYVRPNEFDMYVPTDLCKDTWAYRKFIKVAKFLEDTYKEFADHFELDDEDKDFTFKKKITSAIRRLAPSGLSTEIGWSCNFRSLNNIIYKRTSPHAEEEMRVVFGLVAELVQKKYPNVFVFEEEKIDGYVWYKPLFQED